jgi:urease accessory protein
MQLAEPVTGVWKAQLALGFEAANGRSVLARRASDGPLVVQKPLYPEGPQVCHAIVVHPPGGIAGGDQLSLSVETESNAKALLTTPGAGKWYRSGGPWARQQLSFDVRGALEWLPRETIVFDGALAELACEVRLAAEARYIGWEIVCLGRTGSGERFSKGKLRLGTTIIRDEKPLWLERGEIEGSGALMRSPVGLAGCTVFGTLIATNVPTPLGTRCKEIAATTLLPGLLVSRYLGDSTEAALAAFASIWKLLRPQVMGREAMPPRIWST